MKQEPEIGRHYLAIMAVYCRIEQGFVLTRTLHPTQVFYDSPAIAHISDILQYHAQCTIYTCKGLLNILHADLACEEIVVLVLSFSSQGYKRPHSNGHFDVL